MACPAILAIRVDDRDNSAVKIQQVLTKHGCNINVRLGLHDQEEGNVCSPAGTVILQLSCPHDDAKLIEADLLEIGGVRAKFIDLD
jgi:lipoate-protein ligase B